MEKCISQPEGESNWRVDWSPVTRLVFGEDTRSRVIDVPGADRIIRRVDFFYQSLGAAGGRATVELWGK